MALRVDVPGAVDAWLKPYQHRVWDAEDIYAKGRCMKFPSPGFEHAHPRKHGKFEDIRNHIQRCSGVEHFLIYGEEHVGRRGEPPHSPPSPVLCTGLYQGVAIPVPWVCWTDPEFRPESQTAIPWRERSDTAVFRGGVWTRERHELWRSDFPGVDAKWVLPTDSKKWKKRIKKARQQMEYDGVGLSEVIPTGEWMSQEDQANHRYVIDQWGTEALTWKMASGCTVIRLRPFSVFWFEPFLAEGRHYFACTVSELPRLLDYLRQNPDHGERVGREAQEAAFELFDPAFIAKFTRELMTRYAEFVPAR